jgi:hypothetical protein
MGEWGGLGVPHVRGFEGGAPKFVFGGFLHPFLEVFCVLFLAVFQHMVFDDGFLISIKELGLLTN